MSLTHRYPNLCSPLSGMSKASAAGSRQRSCLPLKTVKFGRLAMRSRTHMCKLQAFIALILSVSIWDVWNKQMINSMNSVILNANEQHYEKACVFTDQFAAYVKSFRGGDRVDAPTKTDYINVRRFLPTHVSPVATVLILSATLFRLVTFSCTQCRLGTLIIRP